MRKSLSYMCPTSYKAPIVRFHGWVHGPLIIPSLDGWAICSNTIFHQNSVPYPRNTKNKVPCQVTNWWRIRKARTHGEIEHFCRTRLNAITMRLTFLWVWNLAETGDLQRKITTSTTALKKVSLVVASGLTAVFVRCLPFVQGRNGWFV